MNKLIVGALLAVSMLTACGASNDAQASADRITKAIIADDAGAVQSNLNSSTAQTVTKAEVGSLSDTMQSMGNYKGLTFESNNPAKSEYTYRADFDKGTMNVVIRLDSGGKVAAYRVFPGSTQ